MLEHVETESSDVGQRQVRHNTILRPNSIRALTSSVISNDISVPGQIVMTQHAAFRIARRATRIDEAAGLARLLACHFSQDDLVLDALGGGKEVFPEEETRPRHISRKRGLTPDNESSHFIVLVNVNSEALEVLSRLDNDDFGLCMLGLIQACFSLVSDIDASVDLVVHDATHEGDGPLGRIEAHDAHGRLISAAELMARFGEFH